MTPALSAVYDELLARAFRPPTQARAGALRDAFLKRTSSSTRGGPLEPEDRLRAAWDDALTTGGLAAELAGGLEDPGERALARVLSRAHRSVFRMTLAGERSIACDLLSGAEFVLLARDDIGREVPSPTGEAPLFDARIVAASDGCAILPGIVFHPPDATPLIEEILRAGRARGMPGSELCDALLRMHHTFRNLSRVKIGYAYKIEALELRPASSQTG
ncbi:MAG TPA: hypothetical protein VJT73_19425 [Polyangiaceae bacterium]|nr:hypothetical protein [Polyangiaceae bacterium]